MLVTLNLHAARLTVDAQQRVVLLDVSARRGAIGLERLDGGRRVVGTCGTQEEYAC